MTNLDVYGERIVVQKNNKGNSIFLCPYFQEGPNGAACEAAISIVKSNLIKDIEDLSIEICTSRHFEACYIYFIKLRRAALSTLHGEIPSLENRPHAFGSL